MERNHELLLPACLKEPDYVADRFHHFLQPDEVDRADRRLPHVPCRTAHRHRDKEKFRHHQNDTFTNLQKGTVRQNKRKRMGFVGKAKELRQELPKREACRSSLYMKIPSGGQRFY